ncbi:MAG: UvrD-helicase domain-containing protein [Thermodesulfobacteriota bacterium]
MKLTRQQQEAVFHSGSPALVTAGAGSGKTRTLTAKIAHLVSGGCPPERILAITFTNKAADEMKSRLLSMTGIPESRYPWVRTYHSACFRILSTHCALLGYTPPLQIYDAYHQRETFKEVLRELNLDIKMAPAVMAEISRAKNSGDPLSCFDAKPYLSYAPLADVFTLYEAALKSRNAVDFDNILLLTRDLLKQFPDVRRQYQDRFDYILVDEYQDTNNIQEELTGLLCRGDNLFCVGDDWQAIYSFRGSNITHFLSFERRYAGARIFRLEQNFRSADEIVKLANHLIEHNAGRMDKTCFSDRTGGVVECHEFINEEEEAEWVADKIHALHRAGVEFTDMAVLYRTKFTSLFFEHGLREARIPYHLLGDRGFFDRKEIMDINSYLLAAVFPKDNTAFERIVNTPRRGIGPKALASVMKLRTGDMGLQDAARQAVSQKLLSGKLYNGLKDVLGLLDDIRSMKPDRAIEAVIDRIRYMDYIKQYADANSMDYTTRIENIEQLVYAASRKESLLEYLEEASLIREDKEDEEGKAGVNLSTIHAAKGLEFKAVFVAGCEENLFPHWKSLESADDLQEERRLMYVAMTRAERFLYFTSTEYRKGQFNRRSRFLYEIERHMD